MYKLFQVSLTLKSEMLVVLFSQTLKVLNCTSESAE